MIAINAMTGVVLTALLLANTVLVAAELNGVTVPDSVESDSSTLVLNGLGVREASVFKVDVYVGALYLESRSSDAEAILASTGPKHLALHFLREVEVDKIRDGWTEGFAKNASNPDELQPRIDAFNALMTDMGEGGDITLRFQGDRVEVSINGTVQGVVQGEDFARAALAIWLGPNPPNEGLRKGLLGG
jgi:hypothetical protein